ncbi:hypothetical protein PP187_gp110 [Klebsiella phage vB_KvM-Eowyn]|uniref:Uncharacterized protein n=1 Tax=Klebsiella phage vB_KvM-Eowyn TaxID=2762819 RepID=A0A7R8MJE5_9CAUD|nr:hypothetical protein PP187_gp110 [Klebsiella phage vB_KvM-Eowyn]CAD5236099.1 hypothetical protein LLCLJKAH_00110 [Klebsiella phage vB_KvM-Eowyn]
MSEDAKLTITDDVGQASGQDVIREETPIISPASVAPAATMVKVMTAEPQPVQQVGSIIRLTAEMARYEESMNIRRSIDPVEGGKNQVKFLRAIQNLVYTPDASDFVVGMDYLMKKMSEDADGLFNDRTAFRFWDQMKLARLERQEIENLWRLLVSVTQAKDRKQVLEKQIDLDKALGYIKDSKVSERLRAYIAKISKVNLG